MITIKEKFQQLKKEGKKAFVAYVPYGFPSVRHTKDILLTLQDAGVDIIELGIPFSDPVSDGPVIQEATSIALKNGANTRNLFVTLNKIKKDIKVPLALMTYYNPVFRFGIDNFFRSMNKAGASGILTVDLPIDEASEYIKKAKKYKIETIFFVTPVTPFPRAKKIIKASSGFIYYISVTGTTGVREISYGALASHIRQLKKNTALPVCVGFGVHTKEQFASICKFSDGAIVGSAIVKFIKENYSKRNFLDGLKKYVKSLKPGT
ncbi:MAG: tryptophan synthase subunit alpha [Candidatus Omnitrophota bacterium]|jgi:tryptophan synthase alpha chain